MKYTIYHPYQAYLILPYLFHFGLAIGVYFYVANLSFAIAINSILINF